MKILQISNSLATGGAEKLLLDTIPLFNKQGISTDLAILNGKKQPFLNLLEEKKCCKIYKLSNGSVYNPLLIFKIIPLLKKYNLVHVHLFPSLYWVALAKILSFSKTKLVYTEHSTSNNRRKNKIYKIIDKIIYSSYDAIITISSEVDFNIKEHLASRKNIFIQISNGINLNEINNQKTIPKNLIIQTNLDYISIIQVASFRYPKDQKTLIKALKLLNENINLLLVGDGELKQDCVELVEKLNLTKRVHFLGIRMDVLSLLKSADIIVLSSHHEGLSLSCIEGMASGKPFIATDAPGLTEIVKNAGVLFPKNDYKTLANEIEKLLSDDEYNKLIVKNCLKRAKEFDITITISKQIDLYKKMLQS